MSWGVLPMCSQVYNICHGGVLPMCSQVYNICHGVFYPCVHRCIICHGVFYPCVHRCIVYVMGCFCLFLFVHSYITHGVYTEQVTYAGN